MVSQNQFRLYYENLYKTGAIYLWGANGEIITKDLTDRLYRTFGSSRYNKTYYDNKFKEGAGKTGADCSGSIYPLSKSDNTAKGYYNACPSSRRGNISNMPKNQCCLVFNAGFTHVGAYLGNGITIEMMNSTKNCVRQNFQKSRWTYYGIPVWLDIDGKASEPATAKPTVSNTVNTREVIKDYQEWLNDFVGQNLVIDGSFGPKTKRASVMALQKILNENFGANIVVDGSFGPKTKAACVSAKRDKNLTYIAQAFLLQAGYNMSHSLKGNTLDKSYGSGMKATVLQYQQDTRGLRHDGDCGPATFQSMFR